MPFIPATNTAQVRIVCDMHGEMITNTIYVQKNGAWGTADLTALANLVIAWWNDHYAPNVSANLILQRVAARSMQAEDAAGVEIGAPANSGGDFVGPAVPGNVALVVKFITGLTGRNRRGRNYCTGFAQTATVGNDLNALTHTNVVASYGNLRDDLIAAGYTHVVASFYDGTSLQPGPGGTTVKKPIARATALLTPVEAYTADTRLDSQRRRLAGRGV
jgi:hypothetical protein